MSAWKFKAEVDIEEDNLKNHWTFSPLTSPVCKIAWLLVHRRIWDVCSSVCSCKYSVVVCVCSVCLCYLYSGADGAVCMFLFGAVPALYDKQMPSEKCSEKLDTAVKSAGPMDHISEIFSVPNP